MVTKDFTLSVENAGIIRLYLPHLKSLFGDVHINFEGTDTSSRTKIEWVCLTGPTGETCNKVKNYITSLTNPSNKVIIKIPAWLQSEFIRNDSSLLKELERESGAVIEVDDESGQLNIQGVDELTVVVAKSLVDEKLEEGQKSTKNNDPTKRKNELDASITEVCEGVKQFALKLGYDDNDIMLAANKCSTKGDHVNENTLLQELVKNSPQKLKDNLNQKDDKYFPVVTSTVGEVTSAQTTRVSAVVNDDMRDIVIDGSNVAMCHGHKETFSCSGIDIVVEWFRQRGHKKIVVFVPQWRQEASTTESPITNQDILNRLDKERVLVFTPSRRINGRRVVCYDDRYIVKHAFDTDSVVVSNDNFRDLCKESSDWKSFIEQRLLMYSFVNDTFMPPDDPLGRCGPTLDEFLRKGTKSRPCPYKNKCTYGSKCRFYHPEKEASSRHGRAAPSPSNNFHSSPSQTKYVPPSAMSCAAEYKAYDRTFSNFQQDVIARGGISMSEMGEKGTDAYPARQDWNTLDRNSQGASSYNQHYYQPNSSGYQSQHHPSMPGYYVTSRPSYSLPPQYPYSTPESSFSHQSNVYAPHQQNNLVMRPNQSNCQQYPTPRSYNQHLNVMPGYVDPRMLNHYYRAPTNIPVMHPVVMPIETTLVHETVGNREYLLRSEQYPSKEDVRFSRLTEMFPGRAHVISKVLADHPNESNLNVLASFIL